MRKGKKFMIIIFSIIIIVLLPNMIPMKFAVDSDSLKGKEGYIMATRVVTTGFNWQIVSDQSGKHKSGEYIEIKGEIPATEYNDGIKNAHNTYICYGKYNGKYEFDGNSYDVFEVTKWEILKPIVRESIQSSLMPTPKSYLNLYDFID